MSTTTVISVAENAGGLCLAAGLERFTNADAVSRCVAYWESKKKCLFIPTPEKKKRTKVKLYTKVSAPELESKQAAELAMEGRTISEICFIMDRSPTTVRRLIAMSRDRRVSVEGANIRIYP